MESREKTAGESASGGKLMAMFGYFANAAARSGGRDMLYLARSESAAEGEHVVEGTDSWEEVPATATGRFFE